MSIAYGECQKIMTRLKQSQGDLPPEHSSNPQTRNIPKDVRILRGWFLSLHELAAVGLAMARKMEIPDVVPIIDGPPWRGADDDPNEALTRSVPRSANGKIIGSSSFYVLAPKCLEDVFGLQGDCDTDAVCCYDEDGSPNVKAILYVDTDELVPESWSTVEERSGIVEGLGLDEGRFGWYLPKTSD